MKSFTCEEVASVANRGGQCVVVPTIFGVRSTIPNFGADQRTFAAVVTVVALLSTCAGMSLGTNRLWHAGLCQVNDNIPNGAMESVKRFGDVQDGGCGHPKTVRRSCVRRNECRQVFLVTAISNNGTPRASIAVLRLTVTRRAKFPLDGLFFCV